MRIDFRHRLAAAAFACLLPFSALAQQVLEDFVFAVNNDKAADVKAMLGRGMDPNTTDANGDPALLMAARGGNAAVVDVLLAAKAEVDRRNRFGDTALMAASLNGHLAIAKTLRAKGAALDFKGWTPLIYAATGGHDEIVKWLLVEGANLNAQAPNGVTALMMATREGKYSTALLLIDRGADVNLRNDAGFAAIDWAKKNNDTALVERRQKAGARG